MDHLPAEPATTADLLAHPRMRELAKARRRFFTVAWVLFAAALVALFGCAAFAPATLARPLAPGLSVGIVAAVAYVVLIFVLTVAYARRARAWDAVIAELRVVAGYDHPAHGPAAPAAPGPRTGGGAGR